MPFLSKRSTLSDEQLVNACLQSESGAWDELVDRYGRLVYSIPRRYGMSDSDSEDVFQTVFLRAFEKLTNLRHHARLSSWLITTTHRECWRVGRRPGAAYGDHLDQQIADVTSPAPDQLEAWEEQDFIHRTLRKLGTPCEDLLRALFMEPSPSYEKIAARLDMKVGSIGPTRARCFQKFEKIFTEFDGVPVGPTPSEEF